MDNAATCSAPFANNKISAVATLTCQIGAVTLRLASTSTPGIVECQRYRLIAEVPS